MISDEQLRQALQEFHQEAISRIPQEDACDHTFSAEFEEKMEALLRKKAHPTRLRAARIAASFALIILLSGTMVLTLSPTARASVMGWISGYENNVYSYTATGSENASDAYFQYSLHRIPEGYSLWQENLSQSQGLAIYAQEESGKLFKILYAPNDGSSALFLIPEDAEKQSVQVNNTSADFYLSHSQESSSCIVWTDPQTEYLICIDGFFSEDELIEFAENVTVSQIPKPE